MSNRKCVKPVLSASVQKVSIVAAAVICLLSRPYVASSFGMPTMAVSSGGLGAAPSLPRDVKDAVSRCRASVQKALEQRISRMEVEMPVGADFGVEKKVKSKKSKSGSDVGAQGSDGVSKEVLDRSDRELCRAFVEMFQPLGGENIAAVFTDQSLSDEAKKKWKADSTTPCRIMSMNRRGKDKAAKKKKKKSLGFAAKMNAELSVSSSSSGPFKLPEGCEVALFVAPGPKELVMIEKICGEVGMGTLVVLLNARIGKVDKFASEAAKALFTEEFQSIFHLAAAPQEVAPNCLLHKAYPDDWILARKPKVGPPKVIAVKTDRPTAAECRDAYENVELGDVEEVVEGVLESVSSWFS